MNGACSAHGKDEKCIKNFGHKSEGKRLCLGNLGIGGMMTLKWVIKVTGWEYGLESSVSKRGPAAVCYEHGNEPSGSIKRG
jgi:hypothetical protein